MAIQVNKITNAAVYFDGSGMIGKCSEVELPSVVQKMTDHEALGLAAAFQLPSGIESMEAKFMFNAFYADADVIMANPGRDVAIQVRSSSETYEAGARTAQTPVKTFMRGQFKSFPLGNYKQHENVERECMMNVLYVKQVIGDRVILELDVMANIYKVDGVDLLATYRANIGQS
jgi:uncharacterized protein